MADLYDSPALARTSGPTEWGFLCGNYGWTADEERFASIKFYQTIRQLHENRGKNLMLTPAADARSSQARSTSFLIDAACDRDQAASAMAALSKQNKPSLQQQASDTAFKKQFAFCAKGMAGVMKVSSLVPYFPEDDEKPHTKKGRTADEDEEMRNWLNHQRSVERWFLIF